MELLVCRYACVIIGCDLSHNYFSSWRLRVDGSLMNNVNNHRKQHSWCFCDCGSFASVWKMLHPTAGCGPPTEMYPFGTRPAKRNFRAPTPLIFHDVFLRPLHALLSCARWSMPKLCSWTTVRARKTYLISTLYPVSPNTCHRTYYLSPVHQFSGCPRIHGFFYTLGSRHIYLGTVLYEQSHILLSMF